MQVKKLNLEILVHTPKTKLSQVLIITLPYPPPQNKETMIITVFAKKLHHMCLNGLSKYSSTNIEVDYPGRYTTSFQRL